MPNPILQQINRSATTPTTQIPQTQSQNEVFIQGLKQFANNIKASSNPQMMLQNMLLQNPNLKNAMSLIQQMGNSPEQALITLAQQRGYDPTQIIQAIKSL